MGAKLIKICRKVHSLTKKINLLKNTSLFLQIPISRKEAYSGVLRSS